MNHSSRYSCPVVLSHTILDHLPFCGQQDFSNCSRSLINAVYGGILSWTQPLWEKKRKMMQSHGRLTWEYQKNCSAMSNCMHWLFHYTKWVVPLKCVRLLLIIMIIIIKKRSYSVAQARLRLVSNSWWSSTLSISQVLEFQAWASTLNCLVFEIGSCIA